LARAIASIEHWPGWTQHCKTLRHAIDVAKENPVQELVIISDAFEEATPRRPQGDDLQAALVHAETLRDLGVKIVAAFKGRILGGCPANRAGITAEHAFRAITQTNNGVAFLFDPANLTDLAEQFGAIAAEAMLAAHGDTDGAVRLLQHMQSVPFEMTVVGEQLSACAASSADPASQEDR
jgi:hypothetical protein